MRQRKKQRRVPRSLFIPEQIGPHEEGVRSLVAASRGKSYCAVGSLEEARRKENGTVILQGDDGGQIYLVCPASIVQCGEPELKQLLADLDLRSWNDPSAAHIYYEILSIGSPVPGGMGGGEVRDGVWLHKEFVAAGLLEVVRAVIEGRRSRI